MKRKIIYYNPRLKEYARWLRNHSTKAEIRLWHYLRKKQLRGYDFHRQKPIDEFILDFYCHELMLGIEVDGFTHNWEETQKKDKIKEERMKELGITILRFLDEEVMFDADNVMKKIEEYIDRYEETHPPSPSQEGG
jgi:very-short-patch-repair endonuclease